MACVAVLQIMVVLYCIDFLNVNHPKLPAYIMK
jgi:hypothetical protein